VTRATFASVVEYIAAQPKDAQRMLKRVRAVIRGALPSADEMISYGIPTYKLNGRPVIYFAGFKQHYSVYPADTRLVAAFSQELQPYEYNNKGTIRFPLSEPVPEKLIAGIAKFRAKDVADHERAKAGARSRKRARTTTQRP
jgi:uncharacterized protein YdhG (YjbR/CyaY superfamily)